MPKKTARQQSWERFLKVSLLIGVLIVNVIGNGMVVVGLPGYVQDGVLGLLVIIAVVLSTDRKSVDFVK